MLCAFVGWSDRYPPHMHLCRSMVECLSTDFGPANHAPIKRISFPRKSVGVRLSRAIHTFRSSVRSRSLSKLHGVRHSTENGPSRPKCSARPAERVMIKSNHRDGVERRSAVKWTNLVPLVDQLF